MNLLSVTTDHVGNWRSKPASSSIFQMQSARRSRRVAPPFKRAPKPPRMPMAMARRVSLFEREVSIRLAPIAVGLLHDAARVLHEGELTGDIYAGSTMMTVDLANTKHVISDPPDASTAQR